MALLEAALLLFLALSGISIGITLLVAFLRYRATEPRLQDIEPEPDERVGA